MIWFLCILAICLCGFIGTISYFRLQKGKEETDSINDESINRIEKELYNLLIYDGTERGQVNLTDE